MTNRDDAPERVRLTKCSVDAWIGSDVSNTCSVGIEYLRADIAAAQLAERTRERDEARCNIELQAYKIEDLEEALASQIKVRKRRWEITLRTAGELSTLQAELARKDAALADREMEKIRTELADGARPKDGRFRLNPQPGVPADE